MDPQTYDRVGSMSAVVHQPETPEERRRALQALLACPTHSIQVKHQVWRSGFGATCDNFHSPESPHCLATVHCGLCEMLDALFRSVFDPET